MRVLSIPVFASLSALAAAQCAINSAATQLIQSYEAFRAKPYDDGSGYWTIGYGHRCVPNTSQCSDVSWPLTQSAAQQLFKKDIAKYESCLGGALQKCLNGNQYGALVSWTYNVGCSSMQSSTLVKQINGGQNPDTVAQQQLPKWNKSGGKVSNGLVKRRQAEVNLFDTSTSGSGNCCNGGGSGNSGSGTSNSHSGSGTSDPHSGSGTSPSSGSNDSGSGDSGPSSASGSGSQSGSGSNSNSNSNSNSGSNSNSNSNSGSGSNSNSNSDSNSNSGSGSKSGSNSGSNSGSGSS